MAVCKLVLKTIASTCEIATNSNISLKKTNSDDFANCCRRQLRQFAKSLLKIIFYMTKKKNKIIGVNKASPF